MASTPNANPFEQCTEGNRILIGVDGNKEPSAICLAWSLRNVAKAGDSITFLGILRYIYSPLGYKLPADPSSFTGTNKKTLETEILNKINDFEKQLEPLSRLCDKYEVLLNITVVAGAPMKNVLLQEAFKLNATHVVLDRYLRKDRKFLKDNLDCNLIAFSKSNQAEHIQDSFMYRNSVSLPVKPRVTIPSPLNKVLSEPPPLNRSSSVKSASSEDTFIEVSINPSAGDLPIWSFCEHEDNSGPSSGHSGNEITANKAFKPFDASPRQSLEPKGQIPLLRELLVTHDIGHNELNGNTVIEIESVHNYSKNSLQQSRSGTSLISTDNESDCSVKSSKLNNSSISVKSPRPNNVIEEKHMILKSNFTQPPPLCSVCKLESPDFGRSPKVYQWEDIRLATNNFSPENLIAEGGFGFVYKGMLQGHIVAIKKLKSSKLQGNAFFSAEVEALSYAQHMNLVRLVGFCIDCNDHALVYEYVCNGSLAQHLSGMKDSNLEWSSRYKIAVGTARGLRYLHEECRGGCIVHRDMRPSNILLTHDFTAMVGDFGLAKININGDAASGTPVTGSLGYLAPEYIEFNLITVKTDIYSYGVVLLELLTGQKAVDFTRSKGEIFLTDWARPKIESQLINNLIDKRMESVPNMHELKRMVKAASLCIKKDPDHRPSISQVLRILEGKEDDIGVAIPESIVPVVNTQSLFSKKHVEIECFPVSEILKDEITISKEVTLGEKETAKVGEGHLCKDVATGERNIDKEQTSGRVSGEIIDNKVKAERNTPVSRSGHHSWRNWVKTK